MKPTPEQTVGPFFSIGLRWAYSPARPGPLLTGAVLDGDRRPVVDAVLELWRPGAFGRVATDAEGLYRYPIVPEPAPHLLVSVFARGLLRRLVTRVYFPGDLDADPVLARVPAHRRDTLVARATADGFAWDVVLQGDGETVFFEL